MTPKRVISLIGTMAVSAAAMHPICQRFADQEAPAKLPAQYVCFSEHSKGSGGFCLSIPEWYANGETWSSTHEIRNNANDAEQAPDILDNHQGSSPDDTVKRVWTRYTQSSSNSTRSFSHCMMFCRSRFWRQAILLLRGIPV